jgi:predicted HTH transcriptional regulator
LTENKQRLSEHLSAFANQNGGGFFAFGINGEGQVVGIEKNKVSDLINKIGNLARESVEPAILIDHYLQELENKVILFICVPEAKNKPVHIRGKNYDFSFIRSAGQTRKMSKQDIAQSLLNSEVPKYEELCVYKSASAEEVLEKLDYKTFFEQQNKKYSLELDKIIEELVKLKFLKEESGIYSITNLGVLICAKDMTEFSGHARRGVRVILYKDKSRINAIREIMEKSGYGITFSNLIEEVVKNSLKTEQIINGIRKEVSVYPVIAIRELLANALIHQDLMDETLNPKVEIFSDRIEITNAGRLVPPVRIDRLIDNCVPRNELLARTMYHIGVCEDRGSGIDKAIHAIEIFGLPPAQFDEFENSFRVTIYLHKNFKDMTSEEQIRACYQHCVLKYVSNDKMTNASLRERLKIPNKNYPMISRLIKASIDAKKIKIGNPNTTSTKLQYYVPYWT